MLFTNRLINDTHEQIKLELFTMIEALYFQEIKTMREKGILTGANDSKQGQ